MSVYRYAANKISFKLHVQSAPIKYLEVKSKRSYDQNYLLVSSLGGNYNS